MSTFRPDPPVLRADHHVVHFYESDETLIAYACEGFNDGLRVGDAVVAIVVTPHLEMIENALARLGHDVPSLRRSGRLVLLDADQTLSKLMRGNSPDGTAFASVIPPVLGEARRASLTGQVRAFGEMVDILWRGGNMVGALALEGFWNDLQAREKFTLLCAYARSIIALETSAIRDICQVHTGSVEPAVNASSASAQRALQLVRVTSAIANAVTPSEVFEAIVDKVGESLGAMSGGLWLIAPDGRTAHLARSVGYADEKRPAIATMAVTSEVRFPANDCLASGRPVFIQTQKELLSVYPHLEPLIDKRKTPYQVACLPLIVQGQVRGVVGFTFPEVQAMDENRRDFLMMVTGYSAQAIERLRLLDAERASLARVQILYRLAGSVLSAEKVEEVFEAALDSLQQALGTDRASILLYDSEGTMRFRAWRGLSEAYRAGVEGHSPWPRDIKTPKPVLLENVKADPALTSLWPLLDAEKISACAFIPLFAGRLFGKFMVYFDQPRTLDEDEVALATSIANHVAAAVSRFESVAELERAVRFNETFTAMLGHDLRNPLGGMLTAAQMLLRRQDTADFSRPLSRIVSSGGRMARMIDQLLDFTRVRLGSGIPLTPADCAAIPVLRQVLLEIQSSHPERLVELEHEGDTRGYWDGDRLAQAFSNLIANAVQHGDPATPVSVRVDGRNTRAITVEVKNGGHIPEHLIGKLFDPMTGGDRRHSGSRGLGLGMYITKQIVVAHAGEIQVTSTPSEGTRFTVSLPRKV